MFAQQATVIQVKQIACQPISLGKEPDSALFEWLPYRDIELEEILKTRR